MVIFGGYSQHKSSEVKSSVFIPVRHTIFLDTSVSLYIYKGSDKCMSAGKGVTGRKFPSCYKCPPRCLEEDWRSCTASFILPKY